MLRVIGKIGDKYLPHKVKDFISPYYWSLRYTSDWMRGKYYMYIGGEKIVEIEHGFKMIIDTSDYVQRRYRSDWVEDSGEPKFFLSVIEDIDGDFIDIGANVGFYSLLFVSKTNNQSYAFEPLSKNIEKFKRNIDLNEINNIEIFPYGLSDSYHETEIYYREDNMGAASETMKEKYKYFINDVKTEITQFKPLDELKSNFSNIGLVKIDVEGAELDVLRGAEEFIQSQKPGILIEIHPVVLKDRNQSVNELLSYINSLGYDDIVTFPEGEPIDVKNCEQLEGIHGIFCQTNTVSAKIDNQN